MTYSLTQFVKEQLRDVDNIYVGGYRKSIDGYSQVKVGIVVGDKKHGMIITDGDRSALIRVISQWKATVAQ
jgi:hypothetical protein